MIVGLVNGFLTVTVGLPSFITTLGTGFILYGLVLTTSNAYPATIPTKAAGYAKVFGAQSGFGQWLPIIWALVLSGDLPDRAEPDPLWPAHDRHRRQHARASARHQRGPVKYAAFILAGFMGALVGMQTAFNDNNDPSAGHTRRCSTR